MDEFNTYEGSGNRTETVVKVSQTLSNPLFPSPSVRLTRRSRVRSFTSCATSVVLGIDYPDSDSSLPSVLRKFISTIPVSFSFTYLVSRIPLKNITTILIIRPLISTRRSTPSVLLYTSSFCFLNFPYCS